VPKTEMARLAEAAVALKQHVFFQTHLLLVAYIQMEVALELTSRNTAQAAAEEVLVQSALMPIPVHLIKEALVVMGGQR
jgi:hypothetical protein